MEEISYALFHEIKKKTIFSVNDFQVIFCTDLKTATNLENDDVLRDYIRAVVQEDLLKSSGIKNTDEITSIQRLDYVDENKSFIVLDIATSVKQGIEELRCFITEERICQDELPLEDPLSWNQQVPDTPVGPLLRWTPEMTNLLIEIRGEMDYEFEKTKLKFRLWEKVACKMNSRLTSVKVTAKDCDDKWRNIVATYRKNVDKLKCFGEKTVRWEYFNAMDDVLKGTKNLYSDMSSSFVDDSLLKLSADSDPDEMLEIKNEPYEIINVSAYPSVEEVEIDNEEELFQNCVVSKKLNGENRTWSTEQCLTLLCFRHQAEDRFSESFACSSRSWEEIACRMNEKFFTDLSAEEVAFIWNQFNLVYDINLEHLKSRGVNSVKWKYFAVMDEIREGTSAIPDICIPRPGEGLLNEYHSIRLRNSYCIADDLLNDTESLSLPNGSLINTLENSESEDNIFSVSPGGSFWTKALIRSLISAKKSVELDILRRKLPRKKLWWSVARKFRSQRHVKLTEQACEEKWRDLLRTYQKHMAKAHAGDVTALKWPFFWKMHETFCGGNSSTSTTIDDDPLVVPTTSTSAVKRNFGAKTDAAVLVDMKCCGNSSTSSSNSNNSSSVVGVNSGSSFSRNGGFLHAADSCTGGGGSGGGDDDDDDMLETVSNDSHNLAAAIRELQENQNKLLREIVDNQQKRIDQLHQEQLSIKALLTQLLKKLS